MEILPAIVARAGSCSIQVEDVFGPQVKGCLDDFDFTLLFEECIMIVPLTAFLLLATVPRIRYLFSTSEKVNGGVHHFSKIIGMAVLSATQLALLVFWARPSTPTTRCTVPAGALTFALSLLSVPLSHLEHKRSIRPSTILVVSLMFSVLFDIARARTLWSIADNKTVAIIFSVTIGVRVLLLILEALGKRRLLKPMYKDSSPESTTGVIGQSMFWWLHPLLRRGYSVVISMSDLMTLDDDFTTNSSGRSGLSLEFEKGEVSKHRTTHALLFASFKHYKWAVLAGIFPRLAQIGFFFAQPYIVGAFTTFVSAEDSSLNEGYGLIGAFAFVYVGIAISTVIAQHTVFRFVAMLRGSFIELIYRKTIAIEPITAQESTPLTLMSADIERISTGMPLFHDFWASVLQIPLALYLLWREVGVASMAPLGVAIFSILGAGVISSMAGGRQAVWLKAIESRVDATAQMLGTMKGVKMTGLTDKLQTMIQKQREEEITKSQKFRKLLIAMVGISFANLAISPVICFTIYSVLAKRNGTATLTTTKAFTSLVLFNNLAVPITALVQSVTGLATAVGSIERINQFLLKTPRQDRRLHSHFESKETLAKDASDTEKDPEKRNSSEELLFESRDASSGWSTEKPSTVSGLTFQIQASTLTMVVGPVGCGKSTFVNTLLGETPIFDGHLKVNTSVSAYCSQASWLKNDTVQNNILGEAQFDLKWYNQVLWACGLIQDIRDFPQGDQAMVGSKGAVLSGGQKQRICLARAVYSQISTVILDDVLSGLDPTTEDHVFNALLGPEGIWRKSGATVIFTTNDIRRLPYADHIIVLGEDGKIAQQGTFPQLNSDKGYIQSLEIQHQEDTNTAKNDESSGLKTDLAPLSNPALEAPREEGDRRTGDTTIYFYYIRFMGVKRSLIFIAGLASYVFCLTYQPIWVQDWAASNEKNPNNDLPYWLGVYYLLAVVAILAVVGSCWHLMTYLVAYAARRFHEELLRTVLNAPMSFFYKTDAGTIVNRFSQDLQLTDMELPIAMLNTVLSFLTCVAQLIVICATTKYIAATIPLVLGAFYLIQRYYLRTSRQLRFLDIESKAPLFSHFLESLSGLVTVRSYGWVEKYCIRNDAHINDSQKPFYLLFCIQRWLELVVGLSVAGFAILIVGVGVATRGQISAGFIGVALINIVTFSENLQALITHWTVLETSIGAVSRIRSFAKTPSEHLERESDTPPEDWPDKGGLEFKDVTASYKSPSDPVLKKVNLSIPAGHKVGICGRSGSGKSSLLSTLFRILELDSGSIVVDGLDLATLHRQEIRSRLIVVPQDPYIFSGSVRLNLDPSGTLPDAALETALKKVQLWATVEKSGGLTATVTEDFFSPGQKQLMCIASAMLRRGKILVLDEATSSVDSQTEAVVQALIRSEFTNHTIIAIAHRLDSILDFDTVVVMEKGEVRESGNPKELLEMPGSAFRDLYLDLNSGFASKTPDPFSNMRRS